MSEMAVEIKRRLFTVDEYHRLAEVGVLGERDRIELIDGELIEMAPIGFRHAVRHGRISAYLIEMLRGKAIVLPMSSIPLGTDSEPQPDVAIFPYDATAYERRSYPAVTEMLAFVEIADSSLAYDARTKMRLYARHRISDYLLVDLRGNRLVLHRDPTSDGYASVRSLRSGETFELSQLPGTTLEANAFLDLPDPVAAERI